jgi:hypothetical protein
MPEHRAAQASHRAWTCGAALWIGILGAAFHARADVSADVRTLPLRREVLFPKDAASGWYAIVEDSLLAAGAGAEFADLRLVDAEGRSRPLHAEAPVQDRTRRVVLRKLPVVWTERGEGTREMIFELDPSLPPRLSIELTGLSGRFPFRVTGRDSAGADWVFLPIDEEDVSPADGPAPTSSSRVDLRQTRRFLRLQQDGASPPGSEDRVLLVQLETVGVRFSPVEFRAGPGRFSGKGGDEWRVEVQLIGPPRALARLDLHWASVAPRDPSVRLEARLPRGGWRDLYVDERVANDRGESLLFAPVRTGALRLLVFGADAPNEPCTIASVDAVPQRWIFHAERPETLVLAYGDPFLVTPPGAEDPPPSDADVREVALGSPAANPWYREPGGLEWLKRRPAALSVVMIVLLGLVAWLALARRQAAESAPQG